MEPDDEFEERAFSAAGPVFLVSFGLLLLAVAILTMLLAEVQAIVLWTLGGLGALTLAAGLIWGFVQNQRSRSDFRT